MIKNLVQSMRIKHWIKNIFLFVGLVFDGQLFIFNSFFRVLTAAFLFSLTASCVYILNDVFDRKADQKHPKKKNRPIASGSLSIKIAIIFVIILLVIVLSSAYFLSQIFSLILFGYVLLNLAYSRWLKHIVIIDVIVLASFYLIRIIAGLSVIEVQYFSPWLFLTGSFLALFLGIGKRRSEFINKETNESSRKVLEDYSLMLLDQMLFIVITLILITYCLYTFFAESLPSNYSAMLTIPFAVYGVFRYFYLLHIKSEGEAPEEILYKDRPMQLTLLLWVGLFIYLLYGV